MKCPDLVAQVRDSELAALPLLADFKMQPGQAVPPQVVHSGRWAQTKE